MSPHYPNGCSGPPDPGTVDTPELVDLHWRPDTETPWRTVETLLPLEMAESIGRDIVEGAGGGLFKLEQSSDAPPSRRRRRTPEPITCGTLVLLAVLSATAWLPIVILIFEV